MKSKTAKYFLVLIIVVSTLAFSISCTRTIQIPPTSYDSIESSDGVYWKLETKDRKRITVTQFTITDDAFIVEEVKSEALGQLVTFEELPLVIPFDDVVVLERVEAREPLSTAGVIVGGLAVVSFIALVIYNASVSGFFN